jgi:thiol-disulfide isomerase/thioredoxin
MKRLLWILLLAGGCSEKTEPWDTISLPDLDNKPVALKSESGEKGVVFLFLESDCPISNKYVPEIVRLAKQYGGPDLPVRIVYPGRDESLEKLKKHRESFGIPGPALRDIKLQLTRTAGITTMPEAAIFVPNKGLVYRGRIDDRFASVTEERAAPTTHDLEDAMKAVLDGKPPPAATTRAVGCPITE